MAEKSTGRLVEIGGSVADLAGRPCFLVLRCGLASIDGEQAVDSLFEAELVRNASP